VVARRDMLILIVMRELGESSCGDIGTKGITHYPAKVFLEFAAI
jgi:hypothetical protein